MKSKRTTVVKFPVDILNELKKDFPAAEHTNPARIRIMFNEYQEMKALKEKMQKAGEVLYGKKAWKQRFG